MSKGPPPPSALSPLALPSIHTGCLFNSASLSNEHAGQECRLESSAAFSRRHVARDPVMTWCSLAHFHFGFPLSPLSASSPSPQASLPFASTLWHSSAPGNEGDQIHTGTLTPMTPFSSVANSSFSQSVALFASSFSETPYLWLRVSPPLSSLYPARGSIR